MKRNVSMRGLSQQGSFEKGFTKMFQMFLTNVKSFNEYTKKLLRKFLDRIWMTCQKLKQISRSTGTFRLSTLFCRSRRCFIDFQLSFWESPAAPTAADLLYFFSTSVRDDIKVKHLMNLFNFIITSWWQSLRRLNYDQRFLTLNEVPENFLEKGSFVERRFNSKAPMKLYQKLQYFKPLY